MFNVGTGELLLIMVLGLIVLGPDKLPSAARQAGRYLAEFRRISGGFQNEFRKAMDSAMNEPDDDYRPFQLPELSDIGLASNTYTTAAGFDGTVDKDVQVAPPLPEAPAVNLEKSEPAPNPSTPTGHVEVDGPSSSFS
jgi:sec-independent protein translocase protein TatB